jgi:ABC-type enterobactin transport system permease subunit
VEQNYNHDFRVSLVGVGNKPTEASAQAFVVAGARLPKVLLAIGVVAALGRPVKNGSEHSLSQVWK